MTSLVWSGVTDNHGDPDLDLFHWYYRGIDLADIRYAMSERIQRAADKYYPGGPLPDPEAKLLVYSGRYPNYGYHHSKPKKGDTATKPSPAPSTKPSPSASVKKVSRVPSAPVSASIA